jgi:hypothetical protein
MPTETPKTIVRDFGEALALILYESVQIADLERTRPKILRSSLSDQDKTDRVDKLDAQIKQKQEELIDILRKLVVYPPYFKQYQPLINMLAQTVEKTFEEGVKSKFEAQGRVKCKGSVFLMTKYPDGEDAQRDGELEAILELVKTTVTDCGFQPLLADELSLHPNLWENIECHMSNVLARDRNRGEQV